MILKARSKGLRILLWLLPDHFEPWDFILHTIFYPQSPVGTVDDSNVDLFKESPVKIGKVGRIVKC